MLYAIDGEVSSREERERERVIEREFGDAFVGLHCTSGGG